MKRWHLIANFSICCLEIKVPLPFARYRHTSGTWIEDPEGEACAKMLCLKVELLAQLEPSDAFRAFRAEDWCCVSHITPAVSDSLHNGLSNAPLQYDPADALELSRQKLKFLNSYCSVQKEEEADNIRVPKDETSYSLQEDPHQGKISLQRFVCF